MAAETRDHERYSEGFRIDNPGADELRRVIDAAFDYRGDITLFLRSGEAVCGYLFNRDLRVEDPYVEVVPQNSRSRRRIACRDITGVAFTGRDTAAGKSWETWVKKYNEDKTARERGEASGPIGLEPESLG